MEEYNIWSEKFTEWANIWLYAAKEKINELEEGDDS